MRTPPMPTVGQDVTAMDYRPVGRIAAVRKDAFAVETHDGNTVWLKNSSVFTVLGGEVTLICTATGMSKHRAADPAVGAVVESADNATLGVVIEVKEDAFRVAGIFNGWLSREAIVSTAGRHVSLACPERGLAGFVLATDS